MKSCRRTFVVRTRALGVAITAVLAAGVVSALVHDDDRDIDVTAADVDATTTTRDTTTTSTTSGFGVPDPTVPPATTPTTTRATTTMPPTTAPATTTTAPPPPPPPSLLGSILFITNHDYGRPEPTTGPVTPTSEGYDVWIMDGDGSNQRPLTTTGHDAQPALSPDGTRIAWIAADDQVWTMRSDGTGATRIGTCPLSCGTPRFSPDGARIAYPSYDDPPSYDGDIWVVAVDGSDPVRFHTATDVYGVDWAPNGARMVFNTSTAPGLFVFDPATGTEQRIYDGQAGDPRWSPDGSTILYSDGSHLFLIDPDGSNRRQLTDGGGQQLGGGWSRDGRRITYDGFGGISGPNQTVWVMNADGTGGTQLTPPGIDSYESTY